ncbi:MAG: hypothetical protein LBG10_10220 [Treponema sp.]|nr:hypothetical protein [Treponema sp.]
MARLNPGGADLGRLSGEHPEPGTKVRGIFRPCGAVFLGVSALKVLLKR